VTGATGAVDGAGSGGSAASLHLQTLVAEANKLFRTPENDPDLPSP